MPALHALSKDGAAWQKLISQYTPLSTLPLCILPAFFFLLCVILIPAFALSCLGASNLYGLRLTLSLTAGTMSPTDHG